MRTAVVASANGIAASLLTSCNFSSLAVSIAERLVAVAFVGAISKVFVVTMVEGSLSLNMGEEGEAVDEVGGLEDSKDVVEDVVEFEHWDGVEKDGKVVDMERIAGEDSMDN